METIIAALISAAAAIAVSIITGNANNKKVIATLDKNNELQALQIKQLSDRVEKHNKVIERVYNLEQSDAVEKEQIKVINHRIEDLEHFHK